MMSFISNLLANDCNLSTDSFYSGRLDAWDKRSDLVHWEDLEGLGGEGGGRGDRDGEHM